MPATFISVDIETSGPSPSRHSLLAIGACSVDDPDRTFYVELQPDGAETDPEAVAISGLSMERLAAEGAEPREAMVRFAEWVESGAGPDCAPLLVALNAPFDWMFVADYFHRYVGRNPFGHSALDMKALYMGLAGVAWADATLRTMAARYGLTAKLPHHALEDAVIQANVFRRILAEHRAAAIE